MGGTDRRSRRGRLTPGAESWQLEPRVVLSNVGPRVGPFLPPVNLFMPPGVSGPRATMRGLGANPHQQINQTLRETMGPGLPKVQRHVAFYGTAVYSELGNTVRGNPSFNALFSRHDTFRLLRSALVDAGIRFGGGAIDPNVGELVVTSPPSTIGPVQNGVREITVNFGGSAVSFVVDGAIPVQTNGGTQIIRIPRSSLDETTQALLLNQQRGSGQTVFGGLGADILEGLQTARPTQGPSAPENVPGLRLYNQAFRNNRSPLPNFHRTPFAEYIRLASANRLFDLTPNQRRLINDRLNQFYNTARDLYINGAFNTPDQPPLDRLPAPNRTLDGTLMVSIGGLRELYQPGANSPTGEDSIFGLDLPGIEDVGDTLGFPGRLEVGYVFDRQGNFGLAISVRNPLTNTIPGLQQANKITGDVAVEVSNARNIRQLSGYRGVEGITVGTAISGGILASDANGVQTYSISSGYGAGIEFGVGARFTEIIPLGNVLQPRFRSR